MKEPLIFLHAINKVMSWLLRVEDSPLSTAFFSNRNMGVLQQSIVAEFKRRTGITIDKQKPDDLFLMAKNTYVDNVQKLSQDSTAQLPALNKAVVDCCVPIIATGVHQQLAYLQDINGPRQLLDLPQTTSQAGDKQLVLTQLT